jgi:hypothetical protein
MNIAGTVEANLRAALRSGRLKSRPVHPDTVDHWLKLMLDARAEPEARQSSRTFKLIGDAEPN